MIRSHLLDLDFVDLDSVVLDSVVLDSVDLDSGDLVWIKDLTVWTGTVLVLLRL